MNPEQLWETTMDPAFRTIIRVDIDDIPSTDEIFTILMGTRWSPAANSSKRTQNMWKTSTYKTVRVSNKKRRF